MGNNFSSKIIPLIIFRCSAPSECLFMSDIPPELTENIELHTKHFACPSSSAIANHSLNSFELNYDLLKEHVLIFIFKIRHN